MRHRSTLLILSLGLLCTLAYLPSVGGPFLQFDDSILITENPAVRGGPEGLVEIWKGHTLDYYPLSMTLFWLEWHAGGGLPQVFRVVNLLLHLTAAGLLAYLLTLWDIRPAWLIVALWMLHPLNAATVAWISEQKNTLSAVFALASCIAYTRSLSSATVFARTGAARLRRGFSKPEQLDPRQSRWAPDRAYALSLLLFILSLLAKAAFVGLPLILLVMIWWRFGRVQRRQWIRLAPMFVMSIVFSSVAIWFQARHVQQIGNDAGPILVRIARVGWAIWFYLWKMIAPIGLMPIYPRWRVNPANALHWLPLLALIGVISAICIARRRAPLVIVLAGLLLLAPIIGLANSSFFRLSYVADHWTYPALMVFAVAIGWVISRVPRAAQTPVAIAIVLMLAVLTWQRAAAYHDTLSLWQDAAHKNPTSYATFNNLAWAYVEANRMSDALTAAQRAAQLAPEEPDVQQTLAAVKRRAEAQRSAQ